jgi:hypothetical protein
VLRQDRPKGERLAAYSLRVRSALTYSVKVRVALNLNVHAVFHAVSCGQPRFLG